VAKQNEKQIKKLFRNTVINLDALSPEIAQQYIKELPEPFSSIFSSNGSSNTNVSIVK
jgi:hypothetical protein